jgi:DHA2 family multidrug resistance protein-like MFS transporter
MLATFVAFGSYIFIAQYLQLVLGLSPLRAGLWTLPFMAGFVVGSNLTPLIARQIRPAFLIAGGFVVAAVGFAILTLIDTASPLGTIVTASTVYSLGLAPAFTLANDMVLATAPPEKAGAAAAMSEASSELGGALGIAILGSIGTAIYRARMAAVIPGEIARGTLGSALAAAREMPAPLGAKVVAVARDAFTRGMEVSVIVCAIIALVTAIFTIILLRSAPHAAAPGSAAH